MMAQSSTPRVLPVKRLKGGTESTKSHRFKPFSQRVAELKVDPIHHVRRPSFGEDEEDGTTSSHFRSALEHWSELNLSDNFAAFSRKVNPLCESLAQILYHEDKIMGLLVEYIGRKDQLSLEPMLSLLAQLARDLGSRFEKHFASSVTLVASVAASHPDVEVVEWCFACLAWIFKFLSRLLVPDLRQLLGIMSPYLGKERQKPYILRFAAESMSFLIRKAGLAYYRDKSALDQAITFLFDDLRDMAVAGGSKTNTDAYQEGLMVMFSEAIKGIKDGLHSNASEILTCLLDHVPADDELQFRLALDVASGVIVNLIHHTTPDTFEPLLRAIVSCIDAYSYALYRNRAELCSRMLLLSVASRKGSRISNWRIVYQSLLSLLQKASAAPNVYERILPQLLSAVAYSLQVSPMDELLSFMRPLMDSVSCAGLSDYFLPFCIMFGELGAERFHCIALPYFQR